jgi:hypothetical protein
MVNTPTVPWRLECRRAFQTDRSWYQAYWYRAPEPLQSKYIATVVDAFPTLPVWLDQFAKPIRTGVVWARAIRQKQRNHRCEAKEPRRQGHALRRQEYETPPDV